MNTERGSSLGGIGLYLSRIFNYPFVPPEVLQISLTYRCNLKCKMCTIAHLLPEEEELSKKQIFNIIDQATQYKIEQLLFTGGEPFLRKDIFEVSDYASSKGMRVIITTNAILLDEGLVEKISKSGIRHVHVSIDGLLEANDFFRGKGAFEKIKKSLGYLCKEKNKSHSFSVGLACTVMDNNVKDLKELVSFGDELGVDGINFQPLMRDNANFQDKTLPEYWVKDENIPVLEEQIKKIKELSKKHINIYEEPRLELLAKYYSGKLSKKDWVCFGGFKTAFVCFEKTKPLLYTCHGVCGDVKEDGLERAWKSKAAHKLRIHSQNCKNPCLQSCYSNEAAGSLKSLFLRILKR